ncbi:MAG: MBL fold metallo-hydrolase [Clostridia bacterium]|nr:MBL fold metallo-hydrolase [Clostridia bacterium]
MFGLTKTQVTGKVRGMARVKIYILFLIGFLIAAALMILFLRSRTLYHGPVSDHFDGRSFHYKGPTRTFTDSFKWMREMKTIEWPEWINDPPQPKPVERVDAGELRVTYINHGTVLIQMDGMNILTDPIWSDYSGPVSWMSTRRVRAPGVKFEDLPKIDVILISHCHYDHLDMNTLKKLNDKFQPRIFTGLGVGSILSPLKSNKVLEMDWWQKEEVKSSNLKIHFVPARHGSERILTGANKTLWGGFVIESPNGKVYFSGDTGYEDFLEEIHQRFAQFRLTILPIGSYEKRWFMRTQHMNPEESVQVHRLLESKQSVGFHYATFAEHPEQTIDAHEKDLADALKKFSMKQSDFWVLKFGEGRYVSK